MFDNIKFSIINKHKSLGINLLLNEIDFFHIYDGSSL